MQWLKNEQIYQKYIKFNTYFSHFGQKIQFLSHNLLIFLHFQTPQDANKRLICIPKSVLTLEPIPPLGLLCLDFKPGDRLFIDYMVYNSTYYHVAVDAATDFLWAREAKAQSTEEALSHVDTITNFMGRFSEVLSDNGPAYQEA